MTSTYPSQSSASYDSIKLGIDAYAQYYRVSRQVEGATPQPVQKMTYEELMLFVVKQQKLTRHVVTCYGWPSHNDQVRAAPIHPSRAGRRRVQSHGVADGAAAGGALMEDSL